MTLYEFQLLLHSQRVAHLPADIAALNPIDWIALYREAKEVCNTPISAITSKSIGAVIISGVKTYPDPDIQLGSIRFEKEGK